MAPGTGSKLAGLRSLPAPAYRALGLGAGFIVLVAAVFAGVGAWQDREPRVDQPVAAPDPVPAPAPAPDGDADGDAGDDATPDATAPDGTEAGDAADDTAEPDVVPPVTGPRPQDVTVQLLNGSGVSGATAPARTQLDALGFRISAVNNARARDVTTIFYTAGFEAEARLVGEVLNVRVINPMTELPPERRLTSDVMVHVVVGADRR